MITSLPQQLLWKTVCTDGAQTVDKRGLSTAPLTTQLQDVGVGVGVGVGMGVGMWCV
jgi:hypothetical protein